MGQIAPRRRRMLARRMLTRLQARLPQRKQPQGAGAEEPDMTSDVPSRLPNWLYRLWHFTDDIRWMDPLPALHRRGIVIAVFILLLAFLWPSSTPQYPVERPVTPSAEKEVPMQADIYDNKPAKSTTQPEAKADSQGDWRSYQIASGQTLAQLFRDNNLPVNDVFAMARVEGNGQPLSTLKEGQQVKVRRDAKGVVTGLTLDGTNGPVLFTRQPDGSFLRVE
ncbi:cell envelope opacity-associated protein A YtfB [Pantoea allii]|uniref:Cell envelope opacity-associated protein A YtfB n=1 Tax=Pantoea allii TaxID=574096 RepID=A0ABS6VHW9_9GAMM|nr:LysM-like peptidoglycan-binding domain-containing protein [Pantoea allii]MBW1215993.1 cell envelope opacity-associated protein A YtfB [Pantoea allii]MBW1258880.1 cell envelope opacity-associated protein A YtfB [Pantoea allii]MBW1267965.1 cell envelope opacity-associated protein A YtfB [Pantoea allii]MBW1289902.1 cell envelope opacity-associated protein A YtfB [Pantoea allii]